MMKSNDLTDRHRLGGAYDGIRLDTLERIRIECRIVDEERVRCAGSDFYRHGMVDAVTESKCLLFLPNGFTF